MEQDLNLKFECRYMKNPKRQVSARYKAERSLHGARIIKKVEDQNANLVATLSEDRADSAYIINGVDENGSPRVLVGNTLLKIVERGKTDFYFCLNNTSNREMKIDLGNGLETAKSMLYKIDVEASLKEDVTIKAKAVNPEIEDYSTYSHIFKTLSENEAEA